MREKAHFKRLSQYYDRSKMGYDSILGGSKHFGFYPKNKNISEKQAQILMQELVAKKLKITSKDVILDAGCGQGIVSIFLAKKYGCQIKGITILPFELKKANLLAKKLKITAKLNYFLMDYNKMSFNKRHFDCIYTTETLSHSINIGKTLKEFLRVLKKGGRIALFEYSIAEDNKFTKYELEILNKVIYSSAMSGLKQFRHDQFQNILKQAGFKDIKVENISENTKPSLNRLRKLALIPYLFIKLFHLQKNHPNLTSAVEFYKMVNKDLIRYNIYTAKK
ncbi:methyltransferase domain-containing protein [Candidatus Woesearchaeota archaeon]|nr:methyltransferase domain-containing protein [Candidatus Woesearchaeota archaeon]